MHIPSTCLSFSLSTLTSRRSMITLICSLIVRPALLPPPADRILMNTLRRLHLDHAERRTYLEEASKLGAKIVEQLRKARQVEQDGDDTMCSPEAKPTEMASCSKCTRACSCIKCERAVLVARRLVIDKGKLCKCGNALAVCRQAPIAWVCFQCGASLGRVSAGFPRCEHVLCFSCI